MPLTRGSPLGSSVSTAASSNDVFRCPGRGRSGDRRDPGGARETRPRSSGRVHEAARRPGRRTTSYMRAAGRPRRATTSSRRARWHELYEGAASASSAHISLDLELRPGLCDAFRALTWLPFGSPLDDDHLSPAGTRPTHYRFSPEGPCSSTPILPRSLIADLGPGADFRGPARGSPIAEYERAMALNPRFQRIGTSARALDDRGRTGEGRRGTSRTRMRLRSGLPRRRCPRRVRAWPATCSKEYAAALPQRRGHVAARAPDVGQGHVWLAANLRAIGCVARRLARRRPRSCGSIRSTRLTAPRGDWLSSSAPRMPSICLTRPAQEQGCRRMTSTLTDRAPTVGGGRRQLFWQRVRRIGARSG